MGGVITRHGPSVACGLRQVRLDSIEEANEFLMPVALHVATDHRTIENVESSKRGGGAVAIIVMLVV